MHPKRRFFLIPARQCLTLQSLVLVVTACRVGLSGLGTFNEGIFLFLGPPDGLLCSLIFSFPSVLVMTVRAWSGRVSLLASTIPSFVFGI